MLSTGRSVDLLCPVSVGCSVLQGSASTSREIQSASPVGRSFLALSASFDISTVDIKQQQELWEEASKSGLTAIKKEEEREDQNCGSGTSRNGRKRNESGSEAVKGHSTEGRHRKKRTEETGARGVRAITNYFKAK